MCHEQATSWKGWVVTLPTVLVVDDHPLWRDTLVQVIRRQRVGEVVAAASNGLEALAAAQDHEPDVVVMDVDMPGMDGIATTRELRKRHPAARVLFLSSYDEREMVLGAVTAGAAGYLLKTVGAAEVADAIRSVAAGGRAFPASVTDAALGMAHAPEPATGSVVNRFVREGEFWTCEFDGRTARVADLNGIRDIAVLLGDPGREHHCLDLTAARTGGRSDGTGTGPALDDRGRRALQQRVCDLQETLDRAVANADLASASTAREEMDAITRHLSSAMGLGGRARPDNSDAERARVAVTRGIRRAIDRLRAAHEPLGRHLDRSIHTGAWCSYQPDQDVRWVCS